MGISVAHPQSDYSSTVSSQVELVFGIVGFVKGGKPEYPKKNPRSRDENQQQTQPTYDAVNSGIPTRETLVGGECSHHCAIPAPVIVLLLDRESDD